MSSFNEYDKIIFQNEKFNTIFDHKLYFINNNDHYIDPLILFQTINNSKMVIVNHNIEQNQYFVVCFEKTLIIFKSTTSTIEFFCSLMGAKPTLLLCYLTKSAKDIFKSNPILNSEIEVDSNFKEEIINLKSNLSYKKINDNLIQLWPVISECISGYLIKKSYFYNEYKRIENFISAKSNFSISNSIYEKEYVELRNLGVGSIFRVDLIYHIETGKLMAVKKPYCKDPEIPKLFNREVNNYCKVKHPFLPKFYGTVNEKNYIIIEFINGKTIKDFDKSKLDCNDIITIIFQLIIIIDYFHRNNFIIRDLHKKNLMIDESKSIIMIDFDRVVTMDQNSNKENFTANIAPIYSAPEVHETGIFSFQSDVYLLGQIIKYLLINRNKVQSEVDYSKIEEIYKKCIKNNPEERPSIFDVLKEFLQIYHSHIKMEYISDIYDEYLKNKFEYNIIDVLINYHIKKKFGQGLKNAITKYFDSDTNKAINFLTDAANQNFIEAQVNLGAYLYDHAKTEKDVEKGLNYLSMAANQNHVEAIYNLGLIYYQGKFTTQDINKAIDNFTYAADKNHSNAQYMLGLIYYDGCYMSNEIYKYVMNYYIKNKKNLENNSISNIHYITEKDFNIQIPRDVNKAFYYLFKSANQNNHKAQYKLADIYYNGNDIKQDINKAIHYFALASDNNDSYAQYRLGQIYYDGKYVPIDINKAIHYFTLAANQDNIDAQCELGRIYSDGKYIEKNIQKAIEYCTPAANKNHPIAQIIINDILGKEQYTIPKMDDNLPIMQYAMSQINTPGIMRKGDINKMIDYLSSASDQNFSEAQYNLGIIYFVGKYVPRNINKAIYYFTLAANQDFVEAQYILGNIYFNSKFVSQDIDKSIKYFTRAADQNHLKSQKFLVNFFQSNEFNMEDNDKAIHYLTLAANQNDPDALYCLGTLFTIDQYKNIKKAIYYLTIASNLNHSKAQILLGLIYLEGKDINRAIHYFSLAAKQNNAIAQLSLGLIYEAYILDIKNAIHYYSLAAEQNNAEAQYNLGSIYEYSIKDFKKAIHYYSLAANQNYTLAQDKLGCIYGFGIYVPKDINKAIHYYSLSAEKNSPDANMSIGILYLYDGHTKDIKKAEHYLNLAANQNHPYALYFLGASYYCGHFFQKNVDKGIHYLILASNKNNPDAQYFLGFIYLINHQTNEDIEKSIHYLTLAANQNKPEAQYLLGIINYSYENSPENIRIGIKYLILSSLNDFKEAKFSHGFLLHEGNMIKRDIQKAIVLYKEASSFNNQYAKNNLGIIYKNGFGNEIKKEIGYAIVYFEEAIKQKDDILSMYNLANIYLYNETNNSTIDNAIELLIRSLDFLPSSILLCISLIKKFGFKITEIKQEIELKSGGMSNLSVIICQLIYELNLFNKNFFDSTYERYRNMDFLYNIFHKSIQSSTIQMHFESTNDKNLTSEFYEGFSI